jgi:hypothetical protein
MHLDGNCEDILPDTPENRQKLIRKFKETKVIYKSPKKSPKNEEKCDVDM